MMMAALLGLLGQPLYTDVDSLDWMAAKADVIVRARLTAFTPGQERKFTLTLAVEETLKGKHERPLRSEMGIQAETLQRWTDDKVELLLFLPSAGGSRGVVELEGKGCPEVF